MGYDESATCFLQRQSFQSINHTHLPRYRRITDGQPYITSLRMTMRCAGGPAFHAPGSRSRNKATPPLINVLVPFQTLVSGSLARRTKVWKGTTRLISSYQFSADLIVRASSKANYVAQVDTMLPYHVPDIFPTSTTRFI